MSTKSPPYHDAATIYKVAEQAGVSVRTVSRFLNDPGCVSAKTSDLIARAINALQFRPSKAARALRGVKARVIGVLSDRITTSPDSFELIRGLQLSAHDLGMRLLIAECNGLEDEVPDLMGELIEHRVDALIFATHFHKPAPRDIMEWAEGVRLVLLNCFNTSVNCPTVVPDDEQGARDGLKYLYELGHESIVIFELFPNMQATQLRRLGFMRAAKDLRKPPPRFVKGSELDARGDEFSGIENTIHEILSTQMPTAIVAGNDKMAARIIHCLQKRGLAVPGDISVLGFDDHPMLVCATDPPLTTIRLPYLQMGRRAAQIACDANVGGTLRECCEVQHRSSTAPLEKHR